MNREELANQAFNGLNEALSAFICKKLSYQFDGYDFVANGYSELEAQYVMARLSKEEMEELKALGII